jgi:hypothetical protein
MWMMTHHIEDLIMTQTHDIRRHPDGSIDFDFYRASAAELRRQAMRDNRTLRVASAGAVVMAGAIGFALVVPSAPVPGDRIAATFSSLPQIR